MDRKKNGHARSATIFPSRASALVRRSWEKRRLGRAPRAPWGFTLLEILVAVMMLSFVFTVLFVSYRQLIADARMVGERNTLSEMTGAALHHVVTDLKSAFMLTPPFYRPPGITDTETSPYRFYGASTPLDGSLFSDIRFVTGRHIDLRGGGAEGLAVVRYYVDGDRETGYRLRRKDHLVSFDGADPLDEWPDPVVCENVSRFDISYIDAAGTTHEEWDSESSTFEYATPTTVSIVLAVVRPDGAAVQLTTTVSLIAKRLAPGAGDE